MTTGKKIVTGLFLGCLAFLVCCGGPVFVNRVVLGGSNSGSPQLAAEWRAVLEPLPNPEAAREAVPEIEVLQFPNGEWVIGFSRDSHILIGRGRGTLVVKDSRGEIRTFFGHVCGPRRLEHAYEYVRNLDDFYKTVLREPLVEQKSD